MKFIVTAVHPLLAVFLVLSVGLIGHAATTAPNAGSILRQVQPTTSTSVSAPKAKLAIKRDAVDTLPSSAPFPVKSIRIAGNTLFDTETLHELVAEAEGKSLTLEQLGERVARITDYYRAHGYPLAQAMILEQVIEDGALVIDVIEARYGEITLNNLSRVNGGLLRKTLSSLKRGQPIAETELNDALSSLSDIPGIAMNATLNPGDAVGTSDLSVNATRGKTVSGSAVLDTYGSRSTGKVRLSATLNVLNPLQHGDILSVSGLSSGRGTNHGRLAYESLVAGGGTRVGGSYSTLHYILGGPFTSLNAHGTAQLKNVWAKVPLKRSGKLNLSGQLQYDALRLRDRIDAGAVRIDRHVGNATVSFTGDVRDTFLSGGITTASLGWKSGSVGFDDASAEAIDAATARSSGGFAKWNLNLARWQRLTAKSGLYLALAGQWANGNLDSSEKLSAGGPATVRAYDVGAVSGDRGSIATVELRRELGSALHAHWQAVAFVDRAQLTINHAPWVSGTNRVALKGAGMGVNVSASRNWAGRISVAARLGSAPELVASGASGRAWFEVRRSF